jgi:hypothetical protein
MSEIEQILKYMAFAVTIGLVVLLLILAKVIEIQNYIKKGDMKL